MKRNLVIGLVIVIFGMGGLLFVLLPGGRKAVLQRDPAIIAGDAHDERVSRRPFTMNQLVAEGRSKAKPGRPGKLDGSKAGEVMSSLRLDEVLAEVLDSDPQLRKFYNLRRKAVRTSAEQQDYLAMISDAKLIADARRDLLKPTSAGEVDQGEELRRLQRIQFLNSALAWEDNPARAMALEAATAVILAEIPSGSSKEVVGSALGDKFDLFQLLMSSDPERAKVILVKVQGTATARILRVAWQSGAEGAKHDIGAR